MKLLICAPDIFSGDAVGNFCIDLGRLLRNAGYEVGLYASNFINNGDEVVFSYDRLFDGLDESDIIIVSYSIYDTNISRVLSLKNKKICYFHGVTPPKLLEEFEPITANLCARSFEQFPLLANFDHIFANSYYSAQFLTPHVDRSDIEIVPPIFPERLLERATKYEIHSFKDALKILYVGRIVPHKRIEDAISIVSELNALHGDVSFDVVGDCPNSEYLGFLKSHAMAIEVDHRVCFHGKVSEEMLGGYYQSAHATIMTSNHEGFCIPILEAMCCGIPALIKRGTAADEVAGDMGVFWDGDDSVKIAKLILSTLQDRDKVVCIVEKAHRRAEALLLLNSINLWEKRLAISKDGGRNNAFS